MLIFGCCLLLYVVGCCCLLSCDGVCCGLMSFVVVCCLMIDAGNSLHGVRCLLCVC